MFFRRALLVSLALGLVSALSGGVARLGLFQAPAPLMSYHGPLLCAIWFPALIATERAAAIGKLWAWLTPVAILSGLCGHPVAIAAGVLGLVSQHLYLWRLRPDLAGPINLVAVALLGWGHFQWLVHPPAYGASLTIVVCWASFLVFIICAERLELSFLLNAKPRWMFVSLLMVTVGAIVGWLPLIGVGWFTTAAWLARHDLARLNCFRQGLAAFAARAVMLGYCWLASAGLRLILCGPASNRDALIHSVLVGFVLSMVVAHGPIVFPALWRTTVRFSYWFYVPLTLLHVSLFIRIFLCPVHGAMLNYVAFILFGLTMLAHVTPTLELTSSRRNHNQGAGA